jgi:redox-sensing transcriptional repressor
MAPPNPTGGVRVRCIPCPSAGTPILQQRLGAVYALRAKGERSMRSRDSIPGPAVRRFSLYLRELEAARDAGRQTVSSRQLGEALGLTGVQVRKDLAYLGQFGQTGVGYRVEELIRQIRHALGTERPANVLLVGAGNLGRALLAYRGFVQKRFQIIAAFDSDPKVIGTRVPAPDGVLVRPMEEMAGVVAREEVRLGILCVPADAAPGVAGQMVAAGVKGILNFGAVALTLPPDVAAINVDLAVQLEQLSFYTNTHNAAARG